MLQLNGSLRSGIPDEQFVQQLFAMHDDSVIKFTLHDVLPKQDLKAFEQRLSIILHATYDAIRVKQADCPFAGFRPELLKKLYKQDNVYFKKE